VVEDCDSSPPKSADSSRAFFQESSHWNTIAYSKIPFLENFDDSMAAFLAAL
jgi:hypothetical protein